MFGLNMKAAISKYDGIEKTDAETQQIKLNTILNVASALDDETILKAICDILELDYEEVKDRVDSMDELDMVETALDKIVPDDSDNPDDPESGGDE